MLIYIFIVPLFNKTKKIHNLALFMHKLKLIIRIDKNYN